MEKLDVQIGTLGDHGDRLDAMREEAERALRRWEGAKEALAGAVVKVQDLNAHVDKEIEAGAFNEFGDLGLKAAALVKKWITRSAALVENLALNADAARFRQQGVLDGLSAAVGVTQKEYNAKVAKKKEIEAAVASGVSEEEAQRPLLSATEDIAQRRAEARAAKEVPPPKSKGKAKMNGKNA